MKLIGAPAEIDWPTAPASDDAGKTGRASAKAHQFGRVRMRVVTYGADYVSDQWCQKGHIVYVVEGAVTIEHQNGRRCELGPGTSYYVGDDYGSPHRLSSKDGATIFVVD
jgi:hypothetical protein